MVDFNLTHNIQAESSCIKSVCDQHNQKQIFQLNLGIHMVIKYSVANHSTKNLGTLDMSLDPRPKHTRMRLLVCDGHAGADHNLVLLPFCSFLALEGLGVSHPLFSKKHFAYFVFRFAC